MDRFDPVSWRRHDLYFGGWIARWQRISTAFGSRSRSRDASARCSGRSSGIARTHGYGDFGEGATNGLSTLKSRAHSKRRYKYSRRSDPSTTIAKGGPRTAPPWPVDWADGVATDTTVHSGLFAVLFPDRTAGHPSLRPSTVPRRRSAKSSSDICRRMSPKRNHIHCGRAWERHRLCGSWRGRTPKGRHSRALRGRRRWTKRSRRQGGQDHPVAQSTGCNGCAPAKHRADTGVNLPHPAVGDRLPWRPLHPSPSGRARRGFLAGRTRLAGRAGCWSSQRPCRWRGLR